MLKIRHFQPEDRDGVVAVIKTVLEEIFQSEAYGLEDLDAIQEVYLNRNGVFMVAEDNGKIVGTIAAHAHEGNSAYMKRWYVYREYRKQGIGRKLYEEVIKDLQNRGYTKVNLTTSPLMTDAIAFYKKNDYRLYSQDDLLHFEKEI